MKYDLVPKNQTRVKLFANKAEAIVFWLCIAGLLFLAFLFVFRYFILTQLESDISESFKSDVTKRVDDLERQNEQLLKELKEIRKKMDEIDKNIRPLGQ